MNVIVHLKHKDLRDLLARYIIERAAADYDPTDDDRTLEEIIGDLLKNKFHPNQADLIKYINELFTKPHPHGVLEIEL